MFARLLTNILNMKKYKITVKHYLDNRNQKNGQCPVYVLLSYKRKVTRLKSAISKRYADENEMLTECKELIQKETELIETAIKLGELSNPDYDLNDLGKFINENSVNGLEVLIKQEFETAEQFAARMNYQAEKYGEGSSPLN